MKKIFIFLFIALFSFSTFGKSQSLSYGLLTKSGFCSATLLRVGGSCRLVTNAHCLKEGEEEVIIKSASDYLPDYVGSFALLQGQVGLPTNFESRKSVNKDFLWRYERRFFSEIEKGQIKSRVISFDKTKDLALIEVPAQIRSGGCKELNELWMIDNQRITSKPTSIVLSGFTTNKKTGEPHVKVWHTRGTKYEVPVVKKEPVYVSSQVKLETSTLENVDQFLVVDNIQMLPGNSGGTAQTSNGLFAGITTRFHATQDKVYIIPASDVVDYILNPTRSLKTIDTKNTTEQVGGNSGTDGTGGNGGTDGTGGNGGTDGTGGNGGTDGTGGNGGTDGTGGNSGTDGTSCLVFGAKSIFIEPYEGYINGLGQIILAIGGNQIDGSDDLKDHKEGEKILRDIDGYPSLEIRSSLLERLKGSYDFGSHSKTYIKDNSHVLNWNESSYGKGETNIKIGPNSIIIKKDIHTDIDSHTDTPSFAPLSKQGALEKEYKISHSDDFKTISLKSKYDSYSCDNRNYLKLICSSKDGSFSISLDSEHGGKARFRQNVIHSEHRAIYSYGNQ